MARAVTSQLIMELLDRVTGPARKVAGSLLGMNRATKEAAAGQVTWSDRIASSQARASASLDRARIGVLETVGAYYLLRDAVAAPIRAAAAFETSLEDIGQKAGITQDELEALGEQIKQVARDTNQATSSIASAVDALVGRGADADVAMAAAAPIGKAATAYRASTDDLAAAAWAAVDNLKVPAEQVGTAIDMMAQAGKEGAFELRDMAQYFPALGAQYQALGQEGTDAVADLAAAMQIVRKGTGDSSQAATNLGNVLQKIYAPATVRAFGKKNIDIYKEMEKAAKRGLSPIEAIAEITSEALDGDLSKLGTLFEDAQVQAGLRAIIQNMDEYRRIRDEAMKAQGVVDADYERRVRTAAGVSERWKASVERLNIALGTALLPVLNDVLDKIIPIIESIGKWIEANPELAAGIATATAGLVALRGAISLLTFAGLLGKSGALAMAAAGFKLLGTEAAASATAVETSVTRSNAAISRLGRVGRVAAKGGLIAGAVYLGLSPKPANVGANGESEEELLDQSVRMQSSLTDAERKALQDAEFARAQAGINAPLVGTEARVAQLKDDAAAIRGYMAEIEAEIANIGSGPLSEQLAAPLRDQLSAQQSDLEAVQAELADVESKAAEAGAAIGGLAGINPEIQINMADLDSALSKIARIKSGLSGGLQASGGATPPVKGPRAKGGPVTRGNTYLVGEDGPELMTASKSGYIHPNGKGFEGGGGQGSGSKPGGVQIGAINLNPSLSFPHATMADAEAIAKSVMATIKDEIGTALRGVMADVDMGY
jgi:TP901 family phage tail tape measure protein